MNLFDSEKTPNCQSKNLRSTTDNSKILMQEMSQKLRESLCLNQELSEVYKGTIPGHPHSFDLDDHHNFITGKPMLVCGNTAAMVSETRFADTFTVIGDRSTHYGAFDCSPTKEAGGGCCC